MTKLAHWQKLIADRDGYVTAWHWQSAEKALADLARLRFHTRGWELGIEQRGQRYRLTLRRPL